MPIGYSGTAITWPDSSTTTSGWTGFKNRIINGDMRIDQRNSGASVTPAQDNFMTDRWKWGQSQSSKFTAQQSTTAPSGFTNSLLMTVTSAVTVGSSDYFSVYQPIEGLNVSDLGWGTANAQPVTLSFKVRSSLTGTFGGAIRNSAGNRSYPFTYTISSANTFEDKTVTIAGDTSGTWLTTNGVGMYVQFSLGVGTTLSGTAGSWAGANYLSATGATSVVGTNGATFYITGVQLERGSTASSFEYLDYGRRLIQCQRYFWQLGNTGGVAGYVFPQPGNQPSGSGGMPIVFTNPVSMRTQPDVAYNISSGNYTTGDPSGTQWRLVAPAIDGCSLSGTTVGIVGLSSPTTVGISLLYANISRQPAVLQLGSTAYISFSAEL